MCKVNPAWSLIKGNAEVGGIWKKKLLISKKYFIKLFGGR